MTVSPRTAAAEAGTCAEELPLEWAGPGGGPRDSSNCLLEWAGPGGWARGDVKL